MADSKINDAPPSPTFGEGEVDNKGAVTHIVDTTTSANHHSIPNTIWSYVTGFLLAKEPRKDAPLVEGGHRIAEDPTNGSILAVLTKFVRFIGPGLIITVMYADPDGWQENTANGQDFGYDMLFMVFVSICIGMYIQYLCLKMATITGLDLAQMNHRYMPRWMELIVYVVAEACIICNDIEVVFATAFAWTLLIPQIPLAAACAITLADTLIILAFYSPYGQLRNIRYFEMFIAGLVVAMFVAIAIALGYVQPDPRDVFDGFLPHRDIFVNAGLYNTATTIGGILVPHALYVGSMLARPRLLAYDEKYQITTYDEKTASQDLYYRPSLRAIKSTLSYATWELCISLFVVGMFINCSLEIIAGAAFANEDAIQSFYDAYGYYQKDINQIAANCFAVSLLFAGIAGGIVSTMAGQTVMEGAFDIKINPFARRIITRCIAIVPAFIVAVSVGADGLDDAITACNYVLAVGLIFVILPVVWYVTHDKYMTVENDEGTGTVSLRTGVIGASIAYIIWFFVIFTVVATIVLLGLGLAD